MCLRPTESKFIIVFDFTDSQPILCVNNVARSNFIILVHSCEPTFYLISNWKRQEALNMCLECKMTGSLSHHLHVCYWCFFFSILVLIFILGLVSSQTSKWNSKIHLHISLWKRWCWKLCDYLQGVQRLLLLWWWDKANMELSSILDFCRYKWYKCSHFNVVTFWIQCVLYSWSINKSNYRIAVA